MNEQKVTLQGDTALEASNRGGYSRRKFLGLAGLMAGAGIVTLGSCNRDESSSLNLGVDLGSGDVGVLNYAYALEQLESAFYKQVTASPYNNITPEETAILSDIASHELAHAQFFKRAIAGAGKVIQDLTPDFSSIDFSSRASVLGTAQVFEDLGVAAYNGAGKLITSAVYLELAGKIVSVEARHAAIIRDLLSNGSFANLGSLGAFGADDAKGLDGSLTPAQVLAQAGKYIKEKINASNLPTS